MFIEDDHSVKPLILYFTYSNDREISEDLLHPNGSIRKSAKRRFIITHGQLKHIYGQHFLQG